MPAGRVGRELLQVRDGLVPRRRAGRPQWRRHLLHPLGRGGAGAQETLLRRRLARLRQGRERADGPLMALAWLALAWWVPALGLLILSSLASLAFPWLGRGPEGRAALAPVSA